MSARIVIIGGGIAGLSVAACLAQVGLSVTVLEASQLGVGASTRNQGWLFSGGSFAPEQPDLARMCHESLRQTVQFCPECLEPGCGPMAYLMQDAKADSSQWMSAWQAADIPYESLTEQELAERFPGLAVNGGKQAFELPDRAFRPDILLRRLASAAEQTGAEIRTGMAVTQLPYEHDAVQGVETASGEKISARLVILAGNAKGGSLFPGYGWVPVGKRPVVALMVLKTHLVAVQPSVGAWPLCVLDAGGFNHIPHSPVSVFGSNRWLPAPKVDDDQVIASEIDLIWNQITRLFPECRREDHTVVEWAGTTVQAMRVEQAGSGGPALPTIVDHEAETPQVKNLLSIFPGRASLWPHLAEQSQQAVLRKAEPVETPIAAPPWGAVRSSEGP